MLIIAMIAIGVQFWLTLQKLDSANEKLATANEEVAKLRDEVGHLDISDSKKIQIARIPTREPYRWRWRIRIPDGMDVELFSARGKIPAQGYAVDLGLGHEMPLGNFYFREFVLDILIWQDAGGKSGVTLSYDNKSEAVMIMPKPLPSGFQSGNWESAVAGDGETQEQLLTGRLELLRLRHSPSDTDLADGFLFWLNDRSAKDSAYKAAKEQ